MGEGYLNEHKAMKLMKNIKGMDENFKMHQYGDYTIITDIKNIKGFNYIYNKHGMLIATEVKVSSIIDEKYLDSYVRFDSVESNIPVYYSRMGLMINTEFLNEMTSDIEILIISNYMEKFSCNIKKGEYIYSKEHGELLIDCFIEYYSKNKTLIKCINAAGIAVYLNKDLVGEEYSKSEI